LDLIDLKYGVDIVEDPGKAGNTNNWRINRRWKVTRNFVSTHIHSGDKTILDIGGANLFGQKMADWFALNYAATTEDLDYHTFSKSDTYDVIFCFEVVEHLMNPLFFLENAKRTMKKESRLFITYPKNLIRSAHHFHEYKDDEFLTLVNAAGYRIISHKTDPHWHKPGFYLTGFRPLARLFGQLVGISKLNLYCLTCLRAKTHRQAGGSYARSPDNCCDVGAGITTGYRENERR
jgi:SAM-dependent methyltransferase